MTLSRWPWWWAPVSGRLRHSGACRGYGIMVVEIADDRIASITRILEPEPVPVLSDPAVDHGPAPGRATWAATRDAVES
jgi:hypothetical protein